MGGGEAKVKRMLKNITKLTLDRVCCEHVTNLRVLYKARNFLTRWVTVRFSRRSLLRGVTFIFDTGIAFKKMIGEEIFQFYEGLFKILFGWDGCMTQLTDCFHNVKFILVSRCGIVIRLWNLLTAPLADNVLILINCLGISVISRPRATLKVWKSKKYDKYASPTKVSCHLGRISFSKWTLQTRNLPFLSAD
jgi:hypothetical protein